MNALIKITTLLLLFWISFMNAQERDTDFNKNGIEDLYENLNAQPEQRVEDMLSRMTLDEKVNIVVGMGMNFANVMEAKKKDIVTGQAGSTFEIPSLGISSIVFADGPAGLRIEPILDSITGKQHFCTAFPIATLLASTWNTDLVKKITTAMGEEVKDYGVDVLLAPGMNIQRNPLGGRNYEYFSEDPVLSGKIGSAYVRGVQFNDVGASVKHFVANNQETNRMLVNAIISERALREIYLRGFEIAIKESNPWTVMSSYNKLNGFYTSQSKDLLTTVLRNEWGYNGMVVSDWSGGDDILEQLRAGNNLMMPGKSAQHQKIFEGLKNGTLTEKIIDQNVKPILALLLKTPVFNRYHYTNNPDLESHAKIARIGAAEGVILLKNMNALPLAENTKNIAAFGISSYETINGGSGSGNVNEAYTISLIKGLENAGYLINDNLHHKYEAYIDVEKKKLPVRKSFMDFIPPIAEMSFSKSEIEKIAEETSMAIVTIGRYSGESQDRTVENDFNLTITERNMIQFISAVYHEQGKKVVVILNIGNVIETASWRNLVDGIVLAWQGGQEAGNALADVLSGKVNPSGKLPVTFPIKYSDVPSAKNFPGVDLPGEEVEIIPGILKGKNSEVVYEDGIYIGYRYYSSFNKKVAYPFGFGLSYTNFLYSDLNLSSKKFQKALNISIKITNIGKVAGKEVVELYISAPGKTMNKPVIELKGFAKTALLNPNESQVIHFEINSKDLASFDTKRESWVVEPGNYTVKIGSSSETVLLKSNFSLTKEIIAEKDEKALAPTREIKELKP